eukprot:2853845-Rhodomonas_salina.5
MSGVTDHRPLFSLRAACAVSQRGRCCATALLRLGGANRRSSSSVSSEELTSTTDVRCEVRKMPRQIALTPEVNESRKSS